MNPFALSGLSITITCFGLALFIIFSRKQRDFINTVVVCFNVCVGTWGFGTMLAGIAREPGSALVAWKVAHVGGITLGTIFFHIANILSEKRPKFLVLSVYFFGLLFTAACVQGIAMNDTRLLFNSIYYNHANVAYTLLVSIWIILVIVGHIILWNGYKNAVGQRKDQLKLVLIGMAIGFGGGITVLFPMWGLRLYPVSNFGISVYAVFVTYAILRHQFLDIEVVVKRTLVFAGLVSAVVAIVSSVAFLSQDVLARYVAVPKWLANIFAAAIIAALYGNLRDWLVNVTDKYLFQKKYDVRQLLKRFTDEVMVELNLDQLVKMTVESLTQLMKLENCSLLLVNQDTRKYHLVAAKGVEIGKLEFDELEPFITFLRETHEPIGLDGELGKVKFPEAVTNRLKQLKGRLCLPMEVHEELIGVICLGKKKSDEAFMKEDLDVLSPVAKTLAIAVSNAQLVEELQKTQAEAAQREKLAVIGTLSAGINHEICNPLGIVKAQCEAFLIDQQDGILVGKTSQELMDRMATILQVALKQIDRATAITQKLSNFAKPIKEAAAQLVSVAQEVDEVLLLVGHDLHLEKIDVVKEIEPDLPPILADRRQLQEVLFNIIRNAGQAIKPPGTITVRAHTANGDVRIAVSDTGSGMPPETLNKIYNPFFTTKEPGKGTGLGLFIVRQIVERNKGRISVESTVGKGTTFFFDFPAAEAVAAAA